METPREPSVAPAWARWVLVAITVAAAALRLPGLTAEEPWFDEVFSIVVASQDLPELWRRAVADQTNPPGFYLLLWGWTRLGGFDLGWMRLLPALAGTLTVPAIALAARAMRLSWSGALVAASLAAVSPLLLAMSSELRSYAPLALVTTLTMAAALERRPGLTTVGSVVLVALHYFGAFAVAAIALGSLIADPGADPSPRSQHTLGRRLQRAALPGLAAAIALTCWTVIVMRAADGASVGGNARWIGSVTLRHLPSFASQVVGTFATLSGAVLVSAALLAALAHALAHRPFGRSHGGAGVAIALAVVPLVLVAVATALTGAELWVGRYLIITLPGWWLLLAHATDRAPGKWREAAVAALLTWAALAGILAERARPKKTAWSSIARAITAGGPRVICANESFVALPLRYHALRHAIPLTVLDLAECTAARAPSAIILRPGTEKSLERLAVAGATVGTARDLATRLPETALVPLAWPAPR